MDSYLQQQISQSDCEISSNCGKIFDLSFDILEAFVMSHRILSSLGVSVLHPKTLVLSLCTGSQEPGL